MSKIAFLFPGQGAQYQGMGKDFYDNYPTAKDTIELAGKVTNLDLTKLIYEENPQLNQTEYTQIAMLATEVAMMKVLKENGIKPDVCAGLSLGEYAALSAAEVMDLKDLFMLIRQRGIYMQNAYPTGGAMTAVLGMEADKIEEICKNTPGTVGIANYNCPGQIVITGEKQAVDQASQALTEAGAKRCLPLKVSGPFHSELMQEAANQLAKDMEKIEIKNPVIPYISNVHAQYVTQKTQIKELLQTQIVASVRWQQSVERMIADGVDCFIEIGPGKTLTGFMKKIKKDVTVYNVETIKDMEALIEKRGELC